MPPKRKVPLAIVDANALVAPAAKKATKRGMSAQAGTSTAAAVKKYKYSDPITLANQGPVPISFFIWPSVDDAEEEDEDDEEEEEEEGSSSSESLQDILNRLEKERSEAVDKALNPDHELVNGVRSIVASEARRRIDEASKPYHQKMDEARRKFEMAGTMTAEETKNTVPNIKVGAKNSKKSEEEEKKKDEAFVPPRVVTEKGFPVTKAGIEKYVEINVEIEKRDPDMHAMYIYNDFASYGTTEVMENMLAEFNKLLFKKDVSPLKKWAIVEGLVVHLGVGQHMSWMMNEDSEGMLEVFNAMGIMFITALEMLHESNLIGAASILPDNLGVMTLFFLDFMTNTATDLEIEWRHEVVRAADKYGVVLNPLKQIEGIDQAELDDLRATCEETKKGKGLAWKTEYAKFKKDHPGGHEFDLTKWSKKDKAPYEFSSRKGMMGEDSDDMGEDWEDVDDDSDM